jgi:photosystem II stability/assembly factor-like uncharacterized protein
MRKNLSRVTIMILLSSVIVVMSFAGLFAEEVRDPLERPALIMKQPNKSVLLGVTAAGQRLVGVGERGIVILSDDDGKTWRQAKVPVSVTLTGVFFVTPEKGWIVGHSGIVLHSEDGGETWVKQLDGIQAARLALDAANVQLQKKNDGDSKILEKKITAAKLLVDDGPDKPFLDLYFKNEKTGFIIGAYNLIFRTEDGGETWQPWLDHVENPEGLNLYCIRPSGEYLYIAGERGLFLRSNDDGNTFSAFSTPYQGSYFGLIAWGEKVVLFGLRGNAFFSNDRGVNWQKIETGVLNSITAGVQFKKGTPFLVTQTGDILVGEDPGRGGTCSFRPVPLCESPSISGITESGDGSLIVAGLTGVSRVVNPIQLTKGDGKGK